MTPTDTKALAPFGSKEEIVGLQKRLTAMMPGKLRPDEALAVAQISLAHGLDPFNGEVWFIPGSGVMVGIKGLRKLARDQIVREGGNGSAFWTQFDRAVSPGEYGEPDDSIVYLCYLRDDVTLEKYIAFLEKLTTEMGYDGKTAKEIVGNGPVIEGIGIVKKGEKSRMDHVKLAKKRAEADAIKQRFDVKFIEIDVDHDVDPNFQVIYSEDRPLNDDEIVDIMENQDGKEIIEKARAEDMAKNPQNYRRVIEGEFEEEQTQESDTDKSVGFFEATKIRQEITALLNRHQGKEASKNFKGMIVGMMGNYLGNDENRHMAGEFLFGTPSSKDWDDAKFFALNEWFGKYSTEERQEKMGILLEGARESLKEE